MKQIAPALSKQKCIELIITTQVFLLHFMILNKNDFNSTAVGCWVGLGARKKRLLVLCFF